MDGSKSSDRPFFKSVRNYFREYCNCSSIHGFRYFGEKRTYFERGWWFIVFSVTLAACIVAIKEVYEKWVRSPVIVSFATRETPIYSIPFPAVTICPETKTQQDMYNHTTIIRKHVNEESLTSKEREYMDYFSLLCDPNLLKLNTSDTEFINSTEHFYGTLDEVRPMLVPIYCEYLGETQLCDDLFKPILTDEGICYTFNMLDRSEIFAENVYHYSTFFEATSLSYNNWSMENGYSDDAGVDPYPRRASLAGAGNALVVHLHLSKNEIDLNCKRGMQGFRVSLHTPMRVPRPSQQYFRVPLDEAVLAVIKPDMIKTTGSVQVYNPTRRECYFSDERKLKYFKIYTALNCKLECLTNYTLYYCGCVNYYMPRENGTKLCAVGNQECMKEAERQLEMSDLKRKLTNDVKMKRAKKSRSMRQLEKLSQCNCMPMCTDLSYDVETSQSYWDWFDELKAYNSSEWVFDFDRDEHHMSKLVIFFKSSQFITSQRHELYGPTDFLANFGGLLGLFTGFSVLSLMEIIYFLTIRLCCNSRLYGYWAGPEQ